jgi:hypothetical protein
VVVAVEVETDPGKLLADPRACAAWLARRLGIPSLSPEYWNWLESIGFVAKLEACWRNGRKVEKIIAEIRRARRAHRAQDGRRTPPGRRARGRKLMDHPDGTLDATPLGFGGDVLDEGERERALAISEYVGARFLAQAGVRRIRRQYLGGRFLIDDEVRTLFCSRLMRMAPAALFAETGYAPSESDRRSRPRLSERAYLLAGFLRGPSELPIWERGEVVEEPSPDPRLPGVQRVKIVRADGQVLEVNLLREVAMPDAFSYPFPKGENPPFFAGSVVDELRQIEAAYHGDSGVQLIGRPLAPGESILRAVLTGARIPLIDPLWSYVREERVVGEPQPWGASIVLEAASWLPASAVEKAYRNLQRQVIGDQDNRPLRPITVELVRFVTARLRDDGALPPTRLLMDAWNASHPEAAYGNPNVFRRAVQNALRGLWPSRRKEEVVDDTAGESGSE